MAIQVTTRLTLYIDQALMKSAPLGLDHGIHNTVILDNKIQTIMQNSLKLLHINCKYKLLIKRYIVNILANLM